MTPWGAQVYWPGVFSMVHGKPHFIALQTIYMVSGSIRDHPKALMDKMGSGQEILGINKVR